MVGGIAFMPLTPGGQAQPASPPLHSDSDISDIHDISDYLFVQEWFQASEYLHKQLF